MTRIVILWFFFKVSPAYGVYMTHNIIGHTILYVYEIY